MPIPAKCRRLSCRRFQICHRVFPRKQYRSCLWRSLLCNECRQAQCRLFPKVGDRAYRSLLPLLPTLPRQGGGESRQDAAKHNNLFFIHRVLQFFIFRRCQFPLPCRTVLAGNRGDAPQFRRQRFSFHSVDFWQVFANVTIISLKSKMRRQKAEMSAAHFFQQNRESAGSTLRPFRHLCKAVRQGSCRYGRDSISLAPMNRRLPSLPIFATIPMQAR